MYRNYTSLTKIAAYIPDRDFLSYQGSKLTVASGKFCHLKFHFLPTEKVGSKKLLPGNSVVKVISGK